MLPKCVLVLCAVSVLYPFTFAITRYSVVPYRRHPLFTYSNNPPLKITTQTYDDGKELKPIHQGIYKDYFVSQEKLNWTDAKNACEGMGMNLATTFTYDDKLDIETYLIKNSLVPEDQYSGYWIGCRRQSTYEPWVWENGKAIDSEFGWLPGEPSAFDGENCIEFKNDWGDMGWNNYYCSDTRGYICEALPYITNELRKNFLQNPKELHEEILKESIHHGDEIEMSSRDDQDVPVNEEPVIDTEASFEPYFITRLPSSFETELIVEPKISYELSSDEIWNLEPINVDDNKPAIPLDDQNNLEMNSTILKGKNDIVVEFPADVLTPYNAAKNISNDNQKSLEKHVEVDNSEYSTENTNNQERLYEIGSTDITEAKPNDEATPDDDSDIIMVGRNVEFINVNGVLLVKDGSEEYTLSPQDMEELEPWWTNKDENSVEDEDSYYDIDDI